MPEAGRGTNIDDNQKPRRKGNRASIFATQTQRADSYRPEGAVLSLFFAGKFQYRRRADIAQLVMECGTHSHP